MDTNMMASPPKLLPCPFCKSKDVEMKFHKNHGWDCFTPICNDCESTGSPLIKYEDAAIKRWNAARPIEEGGDFLTR